MILEWFNFLLSIPGSIISALDSFTIAGVGSLLAVIVVSIVSGVIIKTFLSRGAS